MKHISRLWSLSDSYLCHSLSQQIQTSVVQKTVVTAGGLQLPLSALATFYRSWQVRPLAEEDKLLTQGRTDWPYSTAGFSQTIEWILWFSEPLPVCAVFRGRWRHDAVAQRCWKVMLLHTLCAYYLWGNILYLNPLATSPTSVIYIHTWTCCVSCHRGRERVFCSKELLKHRNGWIVWLSVASVWFGLWQNSQEDRKRE